MSRLSFIGLGVMGEPMATHLMDSGYELVVHTRTAARAQALLDEGARWVNSPRAAAEAADVVFLCVRTTEDVRQVLFGPEGIAAADGTKRKRPLIVVDHSTISPRETEAFAAELLKKKIVLLDAPVSGGDVGAKNGTLSIMVGGDEKAFDEVRVYLGSYGKTILRTGKSGTGQSTKLVNQILVSVTNLAVCEALLLAKRSGLDPEITIAAVSGGAAASWQLANLGPRMLAGDFRPGFTIDLQQKDLALVLEAAESAQVSILGTSLAHQLFTAAQACGYGAEGTQALFKVIDGLSLKH
jgi:3-hydroxyisobutyrate dehydrogenase